MNIEVWKDINGYEGHYQISNFGRIKSLSRFRKGKKGGLVPCKERIIKCRVSPKTGYTQVCLIKNNIKKGFLVHRLVAIAFLKKPANKDVVDHINGNRSDNRVDNLRWCTTKENMNYQMVRENISQVQKNNPKCRKHQHEIQMACKRPVVIVFPDGTIKEYPSAKSTEIDGFEHSHVAACCKGKLKHHRNCKCFYKEDFYAI